MNSIIKDVAVTDVYEFEKIIGQGSSSYVVLGRHKETGVGYAVKLFDKSKFKSQDHIRLRREIEINLQLNHPNIVRVNEVYESPEDVSLVMELMDGGELFEKIVKGGKLSEDQARKYARDILDVLQFLHANGIVHRDLKPENLLLSSSSPDVLKLIDFGFAKIVHGRELLETPIGTPNYAAPEVTEQDQYTAEVDLWSMGCVLYFMLYARPPFYADSDDDIERLASLAQYSFPPAVQLDSSRRPTAEEALTHPWFQETLSNSSEDLLAPSLSNEEMKSLRHSMNIVIDKHRRGSMPTATPGTPGAISLGDPKSSGLSKRRNLKRRGSDQPS